MTEDFEIAEGPAVAIELDIDGKEKHELTGKIALIDADTIAYTVCLSTQQQEDLLPREMYTDDEWLNIKSNPNYDEELNCIWTINLDVAYEKALGKLERIYDKTGCRECEMYFTTGRNFRYDVTPKYKANRTGRTPTGLKDMKLKLLENFRGEMREDIEADDIWVYKMKRSHDIFLAEKAELLMVDDTRSIGSDSGAKDTHKQSYTRLYDIWANMLNRCCNNFEHYEDIKVFIPWLDSYETFRDWALVNGYEDTLTIDRINKVGHYIPTNVQFISKEANTAKSGFERVKGCSWKQLQELDNLKVNFPASPNKYEGSFKEHIDKLYGEDKTRGIQARLNKYKDYLNLNEASFIAGNLPEGVKFKLEHYYEIKNGKAEYYRDLTGVGIDKDILFAVPSTLDDLRFNYYERAASVNKRGTVLKEINMMWMPVCTILDGIVWPYTQAILGDTADNIEGIKGMGKVAAAKAFAGCTNEKECWEALVIAYESKGKTMLDALETMRLVHMHQFDGEKVNLFDPRSLT